MFKAEISYELVTKNTDMLPDPRLEITVSTGRTTEDLIASVYYLIEQLPGVLEEALQEQLTPISFKLDNGFVLSEEAVWRYLFEHLEEGAAELALRYVRTIVELCKDTAWLPMHQYNRPFGSTPIYEAIDYLFFNANSGFGKKIDPQILKSSADAFLNYLHIVDLDHEVDEDKFIEKMLVVLRLEKLQPEYMQLLAFRFVEGQYVLDTKNFDFIVRHVIHAGDLNILIDELLKIRERHLEKQDDSHVDYDFFLYLLTSIYGSNNDCVQDVLGYIYQQIGIPVPDPETENENVKRNRLALIETRDKYWSTHRRSRFTGFHTYNPKTHQWERAKG